jgi:hypothetical protein
MSIRMTPEQRLAEALIHYINAEPEHSAGLCLWLKFEAATLGGLEIPSPYGTTTAAMGLKGCPRFEGGVYITHEKGFNKRRAKLAKFMLAKLQSGELVHSVKQEGWLVRQPK